MEWVWVAIMTVEKAWSALRSPQWSLQCLRKWNLGIAWKTSEFHFFHLPLKFDSRFWKLKQIKVKSCPGYSVPPRIPPFSKNIMFSSFFPHISPFQLKYQSQSCSRHPITMKQQQNMLNFFHLHKLKVVFFLFFSAVGSLLCDCLFVSNDGKQHRA